MIIDTHVHIGGRAVGFDMSKKMTITALNKFSIDYAIVSNCDSVECDHNQNLLPDDLQKPQINNLKNLLEFARQYPEKVGVGVWVKPLTETLTIEFYNLIKDNLDIIYAIKLHPFHSNVKPTDKKMLPYIDIAKEFNLTVVSHTGGCECADAKYLLDLAKMYPSVKMVMVHMGLGTDNQEAIDLLGKAQNLYGDTTWVPMSSTLTAIKKGFVDKIMFGSDCPIDGVNTYIENSYGQRSMYVDYFQELPKLISNNDYEKLMWRNAVDVFNLYSRFNK